MKFHSLLSIISLLGVSLRIHIQAEECASDNDSLDMTFGISITDNKIYQFIRYSRVLVYEGDLENFWLNGSLYLRDGDPRPLQMINLYLQPEVLEQLDSIIDNFYLDHAAISMVIRNTTKMTLDYHYRRRNDIRFGFYHQWPLSLMEDPSEFYSYETTKFNRSYSEFPKKPHMFVNLTEMEGTVRFYARMVGKFGDNYYSKQKILISGSEYNYVIAINSKKIIVFRGLFLYTVQKEMGIICMSMFADELILSTDCDMSDPVQTKLLRLFDSIDYGFAYRNVLYLVSRRRRIVLSFDETLLRKLNVLRPFKVMKFEEFFYCPPSPTTKITTKKIKTTKKISPIDKEIKKIDTDVQNRTINIDNRMTESSENFIPMIESEEKDLIDETATSIDDVKEKSSESAPEFNTIETETTTKSGLSSYIDYIILSVAVILILIISLIGFKIRRTMKHRRQSRQISSRSKTRTTSCSKSIKL